MARTRKRREPNKVQFLLEKYVTVLLGTRKTGKTTIFRDIINEHYNGNMELGRLLGFEKGYQALDGIVAEDINGWDDYDDVVEELLEDKEAELSGKPNTYDDGTPVIVPKLIAFDTVDEMVKMAEEKAIKELNKGAAVKAKTINAAGGGYGRGKALAKGLIRDSIQKLIKSGFGVVFIGHSKLKNKKLGDVAETEYNQLTCSLTDDYTDIFLDMADLICFMKQEKTVIAGSKTAKSKVMMHFRSDGEIDCGSRFKDVPNFIEWGATNFLHVFEQGVKSSLMKPQTDEEIEATKVEQEATFVQETQDNFDDMHKLEIHDMVNHIMSNIAAAPDDVKAQIMAVIQLHQGEDASSTWANLSDATETDRADVEKMYNLL